MNSKYIRMLPFLESETVRQILDRVDRVDIDGWVYIDQHDHEITHSREQVENWKNKPEGVIAVTTSRYLQYQLIQH